MLGGKGVLSRFSCEAITQHFMLQEPNVSCSLFAICLIVSKDVIWPQKILNYMHGVKSAILAIFQKGLGWPCPVSAALKNAS